MPTPSVPALTSATRAYANSGVPFAHLLRASHDPVSFTAAGLPAGLSLNGRTGLIQGTPTGTGEFTVTTTAANAAGTGSGPLTPAVGPPPPPPRPYADLA